MMIYEYEPGWGDDRLVGRKEDNSYAIYIDRNGYIRWESDHSVQYDNYWKVINDSEMEELYERLDLIL